VKEALCHAAGCYSSRPANKRERRSIRCALPFGKRRAARADNLLAGSTSSNGRSRSHGLMVGILLRLKNIEKKPRSLCEEPHRRRLDGSAVSVRGGVRELVADCVRSGHETGTPGNYRRRWRRIASFVVDGRAPFYSWCREDVQGDSAAEASAS